MAETIINKIVYFFSDLIFLNIFGFAINPLFNTIERSANTAIANSVLILIEFCFYGLIIALLVFLFDKILRKKGNSKEKRVEKNREKVEALKAKELEKKESKTKTKTSTFVYK